MTVERDGSHRFGALCVTPKRGHEVRSVRLLAFEDRDGDGLPDAHGFQQSLEARPVPSGSYLQVGDLSVPGHVAQPRFVAVIASGGSAVRLRLNPGSLD